MPTATGWKIGLALEWLMRDSRPGTGVPNLSYTMTLGDAPVQANGVLRYSPFSRCSGPSPWPARDGVAESLSPPARDWLAATRVHRILR